MKQLFKKNQVIITALALMLCAAGYLQFSNPKEDTPADGTDSLYYNMADAGDTEEKVKDESGLVINVGALDDKDDTADGDAMETANANLSSNEDPATEEEHQVGEAVMVSTTVQGNFTSNARLEREQRRAQSKETLMELIDSDSISEEQKQTAVETLVNLTTIAEKENAAELLLEAKGFADPIVNIMENEVDVVINASSVTDQQIAQIEDIVTRKTGYEISDIKITAAIQED
ncbi:MAG: SpoIIIAH-like family protein [Lachnospiraceae bacterium]|nr:SpoIIIAH-like family protein [Lachnospiraceae bacterium]